MMIVSVGPSTAIGKAGGLSEHLCTVTRSNVQGTGEGMVVVVVVEEGEEEEEEELVPDQDLKIMMEMYPWEMILMMADPSEDLIRMGDHRIVEMAVEEEEMEVVVEEVEEMVVTTGVGEDEVAAAVVVEVEEVVEEEMEAVKAGPRLLFPMGKNMTSSGFSLCCRIIAPCRSMQ